MHLSPTSRYAPSFSIPFLMIKKLAHRWIGTFLLHFLKNLAFASIYRSIMKRPNLLFYMSWGSYTLANPLFVSTTSLNKPSSITKAIIDTTTYTRILDHDGVQQNEVLNSGFAKAQSMIASAADAPKQTLTGVPGSNQRRGHHEPDILREESAYFLSLIHI